MIQYTLLYFSKNILGTHLRFGVWSDIRSINKTQSSDEIKVNGMLALGSVYAILGQPSYILSGSDFDAKYQIGRQKIKTI